MTVPPSPGDTELMNVNCSATPAGGHMTLAIEWTHEPGDLAALWPHKCGDWQMAGKLFHPALRRFGKHDVVKIPTRTGRKRIEEQR